MSPSEVREAMALTIANVIALTPFYDNRLPNAIRLSSNREPLSSWRFHQEEWYPLAFPPDANAPNFHQAWDSPSNKAFAAWTSGAFCWSKRAIETQQTNCMAIVGFGTAFDDNQRVQLDEIDSDTILLVEVDDVGVHWMEPGDVSPEWIEKQLQSDLPGRKLGIHQDGFHVAFRDGEVWYLSREIPYETLKPFLYLKSANQHDREKELRQYRIEAKER